MSNDKDVAVWLLEHRARGGTVLKRAGEVPYQRKNQKTGQWRWCWQSEAGDRRWVCETFRMLEGPGGRPMRMANDLYIAFPTEHEARMYVDNVEEPMKRNQIPRAINELGRSEKAWLCARIAGHVQHGAGAEHRVMLLDDRKPRNELIDALEAASSGAEPTVAAELLFHQWVRRRREWMHWLACVHDAAFMESVAKGEITTAWRPPAHDGIVAQGKVARECCIDMLRLLCPDAHEMILSAEDAKEAA